jgi:pachytene checkpoint protein 2
VCLHPASTADPEAVRHALAEALDGQPITLEDGPLPARLWRRRRGAAAPLLRRHVARVAVADVDLIQPPAALLDAGERAGSEDGEGGDQGEEGRKSGSAAAAGAAASAPPASSCAASAAAAALLAAAAARSLSLGGGPRSSNNNNQQQQRGNATITPTQPTPLLLLAPGLTRDHFRQGARLQPWQYRPRIAVFTQSDEPPCEDDDDDGGAGNDVPSYRELALPSAHTQGLWESLHFGDGGALKRRLLRYASSALMFGEAGVDGTLVSWNRVVLLHGPPGTGKTTLCKALAHKLSARFAATGRYPRGGALVEVCAHSLFSKWFSESGKLVSRLFGKITELVEEGDALVFVLVDEVESLAAARRSAAAAGGGGAEPSDAVRAVNALLTQLDALRRHPNVLVLTTSNLTEAVDVAFVDRADIKAYVGPPGLPARYSILRSAVAELGRAGIVDVGGGVAGGWEGEGEEDLDGEDDEGGTTGGEEEEEQEEEGVGGDGGGRARRAASAAAARSAALLTFEQLERAARPAGGLNALAAAALGALSAAGGGGPMDGVEAPEIPCPPGQPAPPPRPQAPPPPPDLARVAASAALALAAEAAEGLSGRALRKLPFLAHAGSARELPSPCDVVVFCDALRRAAVKEQRERRQLTTQG